MKDNIMKKELEEIARQHLGVSVFDGSHQYSVSVYSLRVALKEAFKAGEKAGYYQGRKDIELACDCVKNIS